jgi:hypothetical protein
MIEDVFTQLRRALTGISLAGLVLTTVLRDNVHFGSTVLNNPTGNQYVWGLFPSTEVYGESKGNIRTFGLTAGNTFGSNSTHKGNVSAIGLIGAGNVIGEGSKFYGNLNVSGIVASYNFISKKSEINGNLRSYALMAAENKLGENSYLTGNLYARGIAIGDNTLKNGSRIQKGNIYSSGILAETPLGMGFGSSSIVNIENYVHKTGEAK